MKSGIGPIIGRGNQAFIRENGSPGWTTTQDGETQGAELRGQQPQLWLQRVNCEEFLK
jgi:hypothetical protein